MACRIDLLKKWLDSGFVNREKRESFATRIKLRVISFRPQQQLLFFYYSLSKWSRSLLRMSDHYDSRIKLALLRFWMELYIKFLHSSSKTKLMLRFVSAEV